MTITPEVISNKTFDEIEVGDSASISKAPSRDDIALFAVITGDQNPTHLDESFATTISAHGMWGGAMLSALLGNELPGAGTVYRRQDLVFERPLLLGDTLTVSITVTEKRAEGNVVVLHCEGKNQRGEQVFTGTAEVQAPTVHIARDRLALPEISMQRHEKWERLLDATKAIVPLTTAIVYPCDADSMSAAVEAAEAHILEPIFFGPRERILQAAHDAGVSLRRFEIVDLPDAPAAAQAAVDRVRTGTAKALMKGSLHTDELLSAVVRRESGLRGTRRMSHCFVMDVPGHDEILIITDAAINIAPDLEAKVDIVKNAIDLATALRIQPRVAILSAVETVNPKIQSTLDAAALSKMADRGQITGGSVDGPFALDNAISLEAARIKGVHSPVAGRANILVVPDLEAGNMLAKNLTFLANADAAGIVLGAKVPIILTSRADEVRARLASAALAALYAEHVAVNLNGTTRR
jgi:phosphate butyryltransferase